MISKEIAIVISTGEMLDIDNHYIIKTMSFELPGDLLIDLDYNKEIDLKIDAIHNVHKEGDHYILSDGKDYGSNEVIVGLNNIREYKINKINE